LRISVLSGFADFVTKMDFGCEKPEHATAPINLLWQMLVTCLSTKFTSRIELLTIPATASSWSGISHSKPAPAKTNSLVFKT